MPDPIEFEGLKETRAALKKLGDVEKTRAFKTAGFEIARDVVIPAAQAKASNRMERRAASTLKALKVSTGGAVRLGEGFPGALGAEFGAYRNQLRGGRPGGRPAQVRGWQQFRPWRGSDSGAGYFMWPAIREQTDEIVNRYGEMIEKLWEENGDG